MQGDVDGFAARQQWRPGWRPPCRRRLHPLQARTLGHSASTGSTEGCYGKGMGTVGRLQVLRPAPTQDHGCRVAGHRPQPWPAQVLQQVLRQPVRVLVPPVLVQRPGLSALRQLQRAGQSSADGAFAVRGATASVVRRLARQVESPSGFCRRCVLCVTALLGAFPAFPALAVTAIAVA